MEDFKGKGRKMRMSYYEGPPDILEDSAGLSDWAGKAFEAALAGAKAKNRAKKKKKKR